MLKQIGVALALAALLGAPAADAKTRAKKAVPRKAVKKVTAAAPKRAPKLAPKAAPKKLTAAGKSAAEKKADSQIDDDLVVDFKKGPVAAAKPPAPPKPDKASDAPPAPVAASTDEPTYNLTAQEQEDAEKKAQQMLAKDPKGALEQYRKVVGSNPDYKYAGDVYVNMYNASLRTPTDLLDQIRYAGKAGQAFDRGLSRRGADKKLAAKYNGLTDQLINKWINTEINKIMAEQYKK